MSERDTHFQGFAKLLWDELVRANEYHYIDVDTDDDGVDPTNYRLIIAQRAYDLIHYAFTNVHKGRLYYILHEEGPGIEGRIKSLPDPQEWPPEYHS